MILWPDCESDDWQDFCDSLWQRVGGGRCDGTLTYSRRLLEERGFDVQATLRRFELTGGNCDCEVLLNVAHFVDNSAG